MSRRRRSVASPKRFGDQRVRRLLLFCTGAGAHGPVKLMEFSMPVTGRADLDAFVRAADQRREPCGRCADPVTWNWSAVNQQMVTAVLSTIEPGATVCLDASKGFHLLES